MILEVWLICEGDKVLHEMTPSQLSRNSAVAVDVRGPDFKHKC